MSKIICNKTKNINPVSALLWTLRDVWEILKLFFSSRDSSYLQTFKEKIHQTKTKSSFLLKGFQEKKGNGLRTASFRLHLLKWKWHLEVSGEMRFFSQKEKKNKPLIVFQKKSMVRILSFLRTLNKNLHINGSSIQPAGLFAAARIWKTEWK